MSGVIDIGIVLIAWLEETQMAAPKPEPPSAIQ
jgi:hypothetical protein